GQLGPALAGGEIRRPRRTRRAGDGAEVRTGLPDLDVRVPAAAAVERRRGALLLHPPPLAERPLTGRAVPPRPGAARPPPVRALAEWRTRRRLAGALDPHRGALTCHSVGRTHERGHPEATGPLSLE